MNSEGAQKAPMLPLKKLVERYLALAGAYGHPVPLTAFNLHATKPSDYSPATTRTTTSAASSISPKRMA